MAPYSPGALPAFAFTGLMLCAIGIEGMSAPTVTAAPVNGWPLRDSLITQSKMKSVLVDLHSSSPCRRWANAGNENRARTRQTAALANGPPFHRAGRAA